MDSVERERQEWLALVQKERQESQELHQQLLASHERLKGELEQARTVGSQRESDVARLERQLRGTRRALTALEEERTARSTIIQRYSHSVCLIAGQFHFVDSNNRPLRFAGSDSSGQPLRDAEGNLVFSVEGTGPVFTITYTGTGFLVSIQGHILTNRHVAEPWWQDEDADRFRSHGLEPRLARFVAIFPDVGELLELQADRVSAQSDVAVVRLEMEKAPAALKQVPLVPLELDEKAIAAGEPVILLGFPAGLEAVLAKLDLETAREVVRANGEDPFRIAADLARRKMLRPSTTQGHLGDVLPNRLVYDALTTSGGSGGPLFNLRGHVVGINFAILEQFSGANFGVPIRFALDLLREAGVTRPRRGGATGSSLP
jgi:S1-C subfamily serine protease